MLNWVGRLGAAALLVCGFAAPSQAAHRRPTLHLASAEAFGRNRLENFWGRRHFGLARAATAYDKLADASSEVFLERTNSPSLGTSLVMRLEIC